MKAWKLTAIVLAFCLVFCSCGTQIVASEIIVEVDEDGNEYNEDNNSSEDKDASSEDEVTSSEEDKVTSKEEVASSEEEHTSSEEEEEEEIEETAFDYSKYYKTQTKGSNKLLVFNATNGFSTEVVYNVEVKLDGQNSWLEVPVYSAEVTRKSIGKNVKTYFGSVDLKGKMQVKITPKQSFSKCEIRPESDGISHTVSGKSITFSVDKSCQLSVEFDGDIMGNFQLFVNPLETDVPDPDDPNVIFLTPGVHDITNCEYISDGLNTPGGVPTLHLSKNQTLYIAGGAVLNAQVHIDSKAHNAKVRGRGIINLIDFIAESGTLDDSKNLNNGENAAGVRMQKAVNATIEGVIIRNSGTYAVMGNGISNTTIDNIKIFNRNECSDGIDCVASKDITIKNCYIRSNDDSIAAYGTHWRVVGSSFNWNISNCVILTDCAHAVNIGTAGSNDPNNRDEICNMTFKDIDILDVYEGIPKYWGAIAFTAGGENHIHDIVFEDIRMYGLTSSHPFTVKTDIDSGFNSTPAYRVEKITFKNITLYGDNYLEDYNAKSIISGYDAGHTVNDITFDNLRICGTKVNGTNKATYFDIGKNTSNIVFK